MFEHVLAVSNATGRAIDRSLDRLWPEQALGDTRGAGEAAWQRLARLAFFVFLLAGFPVMLNRSIQNGGSDFYDFYQSARYLIDHGERHYHSEFARYLPSADVPWVLLAWMPLPLAAAVYYLFGCWSYLGLLDTTGRILDEVSGTVSAGQTTEKRALTPFARQVTLVAGLLVMPLAVDGLCLGAFHIFMVWLMVAGLARAVRGQDWRGGMLLGLAVWVKLLPLLGVGYLVLKRKWKPALIAGLTVVVLDVVLSVVGYGPHAAWTEHAKWWHDEGAGALSRQLDERSVVDEDRLTNQSLAVILRRVLTPFGMEPGKTRNLVAWGNLPPAQLRLVYLLVVGLLGLPVLYYCRRSWRDTTRAQWSSEIAMMLLGTLWFSPVVWGYHPTAVVPALAIVLSKVSTHRALVWTTAVVWLAGMALFGLELARALGQLTLTTLFLGAVLVWVSRPRESCPASAPLAPQPAQ